MATAKKTASKKNTTKKRAVKKAPAKETTKKVSAKKASSLVEQNGVRQPKEGTKTRAVWDIADKLSAKAKVPAVRADVLKQAKEDGLNAATASTQYQLWRRFHGLGKAVINEQPPEASDYRGLRSGCLQTHEIVNLP